MLFVLLNLPSGTFIVTSGKNNNTLLFIKDANGDENFKLFAVDKDGSNKKELTPYNDVRIEIIDELKNSPDEVIISMNKNNPALFEPYRVNIVTGKMQLLAENKDLKNPITTWKADNNGKLRVAVSVEKGTKTHLLYRENEDEKFQTLLVSDWKDMVEPLFFDADNKHIYALSNLNRDKSALIKIDPDDAQHEEIIFEHPDVDVWWAEKSNTKNTLSTIYYATDKKYAVYKDSMLAKIYNRLKDKFSGYEIYFNAFDDKEENIIIRTYIDVSPGGFYLYNTKNEALTFLAEINPSIKKQEMAEMKPVQYKARDGFLVHGYLTLPKNNRNSKLPVVVIVHGGPMTRDMWGYKAEVQLLASRGYAVLQANYRGSWGYGKNFSEAGFKQWGKNMQNDISDGVSWLINQGIADKNRVAIYGASYGGYATLAGLTFTPDTYSCGIDYVGPSNLFTLLENMPSYWQPEKEMMYEMIGHPKKDSALLAEVSPVFHIDKIKAPLFIAQGANDPRVNKTESEQMIEGLRNRGVDVIYMLKENEGHGFRLEENRLEFYKAMCGFLAKYNPVYENLKP